MTATAQPQTRFETKHDAPPSASAPPTDKRELARRALERITMERHPEMPPDLQNRWDLAKTFYESNLCPKNYENVSQVFLALQLGAELGLAPFYTLSNVAVVNGRAGLMYNAKLAVARSTGLLEEYSEELTEIEARIWIKRMGRPGFWSSFTMAEAEVAGLTRNRGSATSLYKLYPRRMLRARAGSWALDREFGDVLAGLMSTEELEGEPGEVTAPANGAIAGTPTPTWTMTGDRWIVLQRIRAAVKIPAPEFERLERSVTGGRTLERQKDVGYPLYSEAEFMALKVAIESWKAPTAAAGAALQAREAQRPAPAAPPAETAPPPADRAPVVAEVRKNASPEQIGRICALVAETKGKGADPAEVVTVILGEPFSDLQEELYADEAVKVIEALERQVKKQ